MVVLEEIYTSEGHKTYRLFFQLQCVPIPSCLKAAVCHLYVASFTKIEGCMFEIKHACRNYVLVTLVSAQKPIKKNNDDET